MTLTTTLIYFSLGQASCSSGLTPGNLNALCAKCRKLCNVGSPMWSDLYPCTQSSDIPAFGNGSLPVSFSVTVLLYGLVWVVHSSPVQDPVGTVLPLCVLQEWNTSCNPCGGHVSKFLPSLCCAAGDVLPISWPNGREYQSLCLPVLSQVCQLSQS